MPTVEIYRNGEKTASKEFRAQFFIIKEMDADRLRWEADEEQGLSKEGGEIHIWVQTVSFGSTVKRRILFVRPDWRLIVDGVSMEQKFYPDPVDVEGKTIELQYGDYSFICSFSSTTSPAGNSLMH